MKHQYFGDVSDYRQYGLLRALQSASRLRLGVCWMLTRDDGRSDGRFTAYLGDAPKWRGYDPELFDLLRATVPVEQRMGHVRARNILPGAVLFDQYLPSDLESRRDYFVQAHEKLRNAELLFFDPDNGIEVPSCPIGRKRSNKYLSWQEISDTYEAGQSILVYQHFRRETRQVFMHRLRNELQSKTGAAAITCFVTSNVAFFLLAQASHVASLERATTAVAERWSRQIHVWP